MNTSVIQKFLLNPYFVSVTIPLIFLCCGSIAKKISRGTAWEKKDFYLGVDAALAAMTSALIYIYDLAKEMQSKTPVPPETFSKMNITASFLCVSFLLLLYILATHQDWEKKPADSQQFWRLGIWMNFLGCGLMCAFVLLVKGL
jgi:hypothetical protein